MAAFKPIAGNTEGKHGPAAHGALGDEAHEWRDGTLHSFLVGGMANRRQPLDCILTTAGKVNTYAHELYEDAKAILADPTLDPECYVFIYEAAPEDDWTDPRVWEKANPSFGDSPKKEFLASQCRDALRSPRLENNFRAVSSGPLDRASDALAADASLALIMVGWRCGWRWRFRPGSDRVAGRGCFSGCRLRGVAGLTQPRQKYVPRMETK